ncbi:MAG TPA: hypothetical protein VLA76_04880, partial [Candidatus Angelobacter sp.]|nr:hypothetical protein [Candidatus Angelobacter sp.]
TIDSIVDGSFARTVVTGSDGAIGVNGPNGTVCTFTETAAPSGYLPPAPPANSTTLTIQGGGEQASHTFVNTRALPNVSVTKSASHSTVLAPFTNLAFTLTATNTGNAAADGVVISDQVDTDLDIVSATWDNDPGTAGGTGSCSVSAANLVTCSVGSLAASDGNTTGAEPDVATATITVDVPTEACGTISNVATVSATNEGTAEAADNTSNTVNVTVNCPDASVQKTATSPVILGGQAAAFSITVGGGTLGTASDVTLTDVVPTGYSWTVGGADIGDCGLSAGDTLTGGATLTCNFGPLDPNETKTVSISASTTLDSCGAEISNTATIAVAGDTNTANNSSTATIDVECPDVAIDKSASSLSILAPDTLIYTLLVTNEGDATAHGVVILDDLDDDLTIVGNVEYDLGDDGSTDGTCAVSAGNVIECEIGDLAAGASVSVSITVQVSDAACADDLANTASVAADNEPAGLGENNQDSVQVSVDCPDVSVTKTATDPDISSTETAAFSITVNGGALGTASDVTLSDIVPAGFSWTVGGPDIEDCGLEAGDVLAGGSALSCNFGPLGPNAERTITLTAATLATTCDLTISNTATVSADGDSNVTNNSSTATIDVECPELEIGKEANADVVSAGQPISFWITLGNAGDGTAFDVTLTDALPNGDGIAWAIAELWVRGDQVDQIDIGEVCSLSDAPDQELDCEVGDLGTGEGVAVKVESQTDASSCAAYPNAALGSASNHAEIASLIATVVVECPGLNLVKTADADPIQAGETASYTITVWNTGPGTAFDVLVEDTIPAGWTFDGSACDELASSTEGGDEAWSCTIHSLGVSDMAGGIQIHVSGPTTRDDCGLLSNTAFASASNSNDELDSTATITVTCPTIALAKANDTEGPVLPGSTVTYTLTLTVDDGPAEDVEVVDLLPDGLEAPTNISDGGVFDAVAGTITWSLGDLTDGQYTLSYQATVADDVEHGEELVNAAAATSPNTQCPDLESIEPECQDTSTVVVRVPTLVLDKEADADLITITIDGDEITVEPEAVTWTLTWTLTNGPVTNAVISDELPAGLVYVDGSASDGGAYDAATRTISWAFAELTESGSVTFQTSVDPETISRTAPTVNVAVIGSDQTPDDEGSDEVRVTVEQELGGNPTPTPTPRLPDTAMGLSPDGRPVTVPVELLVALFLGSLSMLAVANARAVRSSRR